MTTCTSIQLFVNGRGPVHTLTERRVTTDAVIAVQNQRGIKGHVKHISTYTCSILIAIGSVAESRMISVILA